MSTIAPSAFFRNWRGSFVGAASTTAAVLLLSWAARFTFSEEGAILVMTSAPVAMAFGVALGWLARVGRLRLPAMLWLGVVAALLTAPLTGLGLDLWSGATNSGRVEIQFFGFAIVGAVTLLPGIIVAGLATGWLVSRATREARPGLAGPVA